MTANMEEHCTAVSQDSIGEQRVRRGSQGEDGQDKDEYGGPSQH